MKNIVPCHPADPSLLLSRQDPTDDLKLVGMRGCVSNGRETFILSIRGQSTSFVCFINFIPFL
jgi:hypothetical protein